MGDRSYFSDKLSSDDNNLGSRLNRSAVAISS
jgi:hypothetical protein